MKRCDSLTELCDVSGSAVVAVVAVALEEEMVILA